ncbi:MAG: hypothetical protein HXM38_06055 [Isoptericola variabilis]|nr:hypothetical protein [Isoptericola variabilis]
MDTTISDDEFINTLTSLIDRPLWALSEDHFYFNGPDPQIMMHVWREDGFYFGGTSERSYRPHGDIRANDLIPVKQWLMMELFDFLRLSWKLEDIGIAFRRLSPAPHWSQDLETGELLHEGSSTGIIANDSSQVAANLPWFLKHSPERLLEIAHIENTKEACQALFGTPRIPFA